ncbi:tetratricopeptide repeat protein [soil metagenome]
MKSLKFAEKFGFRIFSTLFIVLALASFANAQNGLKEFFGLLEKGEKQKALQSITKSINEQPAANNLNYYLGYAHIQLGQLDKANEAFDKGIAKNEKEAIMYAGKGHVMLLKKNAAGAKVMFDKATALSKSKNAEVFRAIGRAYMSEPPALKEAITALEKAKELNVDNTQTYFLLGDAYLAQKNGGSAVTSYEWAAHYEPSNGKGFYKAGMVYLRSRDYKVAEDAFKKSIAGDPNYAPSYDELAELAYLNSDGPQAVTYYQKYLDLTGNRDEDRGRFAFYLLMTKDFARANAIFAELVKKSDVSLTTIRYYGAALFEEGKFADSRIVFEQYFAKADTSIIKPVDYKYIAQDLLELKEDSLAVEYLKKSLKKEPKQPELVKLLATTQYKRKKYAEAAIVYKQIMAGSKTINPNDLYSLGRAYYFAKQYLPADTAFTKLIEVQPAQMVGHLYKARVQSQFEETEKKPGLAKPFYDKVVELGLLTPDKYKVELVEAYKYLGAYYGITKDDMGSAKNYFNKILAIDPNDPTAKNFFIELKKAEQKK